MTDRRDDQPAPAGGPSVFNSRGQRLNEIDLDTYRPPQTIAEMTDDDWQLAEAALREFDGGAR